MDKVMAAIVSWFASILLEYDIPYTVEDGVIVEVIIPADTKYDERILCEIWNHYQGFLSVEGYEMKYKWFEKVVSSALAFCAFTGVKETMEFFMWVMEDNIMSSGVSSEDAEQL